MAENYQFERTSATANGGQPVEVLAAPPPGVSYRIVYVNGFNNSGGARQLLGRVLIDGGSSQNRCFLSASVNNNNQFVASYYAIALAEWPTIAVLSDADETFEIAMVSGTGTMEITVIYEIMDQTGPRTVRSAFSSTNGTSGVELIPVPDPETVHRVLMVNGLNNSGVNQTLYLDAGTGGTDRMATLYSALTDNFWMYHSTHQPPFPPLILSGAADSLVMSLSAVPIGWPVSGDIDIAAYYEVLDRRVVV